MNCSEREVDSTVKHRKWICMQCFWQQSNNWRFVGRTSCN